MTLSRVAKLIKTKEELRVPLDWGSKRKPSLGWWAEGSGVEGGGFPEEKGGRRLPLSPVFTLSPPSLTFPKTAKEN